jgi:hypothetical protein
VQESLSVLFVVCVCVHSSNALPCLTCVCHCLVLLLVSKFPIFRLTIGSTIPPIMLFTHQTPLMLSWLCGHTDALLYADPAHLYLHVQYGQQSTFFDVYCIGSHFLSRFNRCTIQQTLWNTVFLRNSVTGQLVKTFLAFYKICSFITVSKTAHHCTQF